MSMDFSESAMQDMYNLYESTLEEINNTAKNSIDSLVEEAKKCKYEPVVKTIDYAVNTFYNVEMRQSCTKAINDWKDSEASFSKFLRSVHAGDQAVSKAKEQESKIASLIESWESLDDGGIQSVQADDGVITQENFESMISVVQQGATQFQEIEDNCKQNLESQAEDNVIYNCISPLVLSTITIVKTGFSNIGQELSKIAESYGESVAAASSAASEFASDLNSKAESLVSDGVSHLNENTNKLLN